MAWDGWEHVARGRPASHSAAQHCPCIPPEDVYLLRHGVGRANDLGRGPGQRASLAVHPRHVCLDLLRGGVCAHWVGVWCSGGLGVVCMWAGGVKEWRVGAGGVARRRGAHRRFAQQQDCGGMSGPVYQPASLSILPSSPGAANVAPCLLAETKIGDLADGAAVAVAQQQVGALQAGGGPAGGRRLVRSDMLGGARGHRRRVAISTLAASPDGMHSSACRLAAARLEVKVYQALAVQVLHALCGREE